VGHEKASISRSGPRNPCPDKLGVVEEGAFADLLLVDGDPIANIQLVEDPRPRSPTDAA
jgi:imidazolonepropionase-like amidohydrolase